jgi:hypothetical protein
VLEVDPSVPPAHFEPSDVVSGRTDWVSITAYGRSATGTEIEVTLHLIEGRLYELEIWDGTWTQGQSRGEMPDPATLDHHNPGIRDG